MQNGLQRSAVQSKHREDNSPEVSRGNPAQNLPVLPGLVLKLNLPKLHLVPLNGKFLNSNDPDRVLRARETDHPSQTFVFTKTSGPQLG